MFFLPPVIISSKTSCSRVPMVPWPVCLSWMEHPPITERLQVRSPVRACMIPSPGTYGRQPANVSLSHWCFSLSPFFSLKAMEKIVFRWEQKERKKKMSTALALLKALPKGYHTSSPARILNSDIHSRYGLSCMILITTNLCLNSFKLHSHHWGIHCYDPNFVDEENHYVKWQKLFLSLPKLLNLRLES